MRRFRMIAGTCLMALALTSSLHADEPVDQAALQADLAELKALARQLQSQIARLDSRLGPKVASSELKLNDLVIVEINRRSTKMSEEEHAQRKTPKLTPLPTINAKIVAIRSNGDCELSGHRTHGIDGVRHEERLSGIVQRECIDNQRHVTSNAIRDLRIDTRRTTANE